MPRHNHLYTAGLSGLLSLLTFGLTAEASAQTTRWVGTTGGWSDAANWSDGEPTSGVDAEVHFASTPTITLSGETCRNLTTGIDQGGSTLMVQSGSLTVVNRLHLGFGVSGSMQQTGGSVSAEELVLANVGTTATSTMSGGTLTLNRATIGSASLGSASFSTLATNPVVTIAHQLRVAHGGTYVCGAGSLTVGSAATDSTIVEGAFLLSNSPTVNLTTMTMADGGTIGFTVVPTGISKIQVAGVATINGLLLVNDVLAPDGDYEVLRAGTLQGTFDSTLLAEHWSYRIEGSSLFITKNSVPVEPATWGGIKATPR